METILSEYSQFFQKVFMKMKECSDFRTFLGLYRMTDTEFQGRKGLSNCIFYYQYSHYNQITLQMEDYIKKLKAQREISEKKQQFAFQRYGEHLKSQLQQISKLLTRKNKPKKESQILNIALNSSKKQVPQVLRLPSKSNHSSMNSQESGLSDGKDSQKQTKRNYIYDTQSFKEDPESPNENSSQSSNQIFAKIFLGKSAMSQTVSTASSHRNKTKEEYSKNSLMITDFVLGKKLGSGKFGEVFVARHKKSGFICAIKKITKNNMDPKLMIQLIRQIKIQSFLNHPNIVKLYAFFADEKYIYLVQQLCYSGQLYSYLKKKRKIGQDIAKVIVQQICKALDYMHECEIIHRDLKPQNIIFHNGLIKICDFGWSISSKTMRETFCGTPLYVSPELLKRKNYNNKIDVWSVGILTYELLFGRVPFQIVTQKDFVKIIEDQIKFTKAMSISEEAKQFILICLRKDPRDRYTVPELLEHPFISNIQNPTLAQLS